MCCLVSDSLMSYSKVKSLYQELCKLNCYFTLDFFPVVVNSSEMLCFINKKNMCSARSGEEIGYDFQRIGFQKPLQLLKVEFKPFLLGPCKCCACQVGPWPRNVKNQFSHTNFLPCGFLGCPQREHHSVLRHWSQ